jgi:hypothetical protein
VKSGALAAFAVRRRLTGGQLDVRTVAALDRNLIRRLRVDSSHIGCLQGAVIGVSVQCSHRVARSSWQGKLAKGIAGD